MDLFWSELKFWWKRRIKAWSLFFGVPLCVWLSYVLFNPVRIFIVGIRLHHLNGTSDFYFAAFLWFVCVLLTVLKAVSVIWPTEIETGTTIPSSAYTIDPTVWPPPPKQPK